MDVERGVDEENVHAAEDNTLVDYHLELDGRLFDEEGIHLHGHPSQKQPDDWYPYNDRVQFELADLCYRQIQLSASHIDSILQLWSTTVDGSPSPSPFQNHKDMYQTIDRMPLRDIPWSSFSLQYNGEKPMDEVPQWMDASYEICYRDPRPVIHNILGHPGFKDDMDYVPYREYDASTGEWLWQDFMLGDWAWMQVDEIAKDRTTHGFTFVPVILGSNKTVVSVATGHTEYWPLYMSIGNVCNHLRHAHKGAIAVIGFLSIPKTKKKHASSPEFRKFKHKLFHCSIKKILQPLHVAMTIPELVRFGDGHYRQVLYSLGPYIADYEEQVLLSCIVRGWCGKCITFPDDLDAGGPLRSREHLKALFETMTTNIMWDQYANDLVLAIQYRFPRADIYKLLAPDLLHQLIKGVFKDHLVAWVELFLEKEHGTAHAQEIMDDIDKWCVIIANAIVYMLTWCGFEQWTRNDSKALMKVYLLAIKGHVPSDVVRCFQAFLDFCYIARSDFISKRTLEKLEAALTLFHRHQAIFQDTGVRGDISLPRQHSMMHYSMLIHLFGAPNGLCSSITESKHIEDVKEPWQQSNRYYAIIQMLRTIQRLTKLLAARADFRAWGMMNDSNLNSHANAQQPLERQPFNTPNGVDDTSAPPPPPTTRTKPLQAVDSDVQLGSIPCRIHVFNCAIATFHTPSDPSNNNGLRDEVIRATPSWLKGMPCYDCIFINSDNELQGMRGMEVTRAMCFFSFEYLGITYPCALVHWFSHISDEPDKTTGMWMVNPDFEDGGKPIMAVIHIDCIFRAAHLIPIFGESFVPDHITPDNSLEYFKGFYVNHFIDHHAFDIAS
ncbi:hypothetical protein EI94DRAFT_1807666 [Lactarius quietus]|nr:hypothetical protein EI94DRAFT_1807666 [Lactarius quietus]